MQAGIFEAAEQLADRVEFVVVHDRENHDSLPEGLSKEFHPTLPHDRYMQVLASCDIALLPLTDTPFNRLKSDLKFIECCAAGVVPICSPVVYDEVGEHRDIGIFASTPDEWCQGLIALCNSPQEIVRHRKLGIAYVQQKRMHCHQVGVREIWYRGLFESREELERQRQQRVTTVQPLENAIESNS